MLTRRRAGLACRPVMVAPRPEELLMSAQRLRPAVILAIVTMSVVALAAWYGVGKPDVRRELADEREHRADDRFVRQPQQLHDHRTWCDPERLRLPLRQGPGRSAVQLERYAGVTRLHPDRTHPPGRDREHELRPEEHVLVDRPGNQDREQWRASALPGGRVAWRGQRLGLWQGADLAERLSHRRLHEDGQRRYNSSSTGIWCIRSTSTSAT